MKIEFQYLSYVLFVTLAFFNFAAVGYAHDAKGLGACGIVIEKAPCSPENRNPGDKKFCSIKTPEFETNHCQQHRKDFTRKFEDLMAQDAQDLVKLESLSRYSKNIEDWTTSLDRYAARVAAYRKEMSDWKELGVACKSGVASICAKLSDSRPLNVSFAPQKCGNFAGDYPKYEPVVSPGQGIDYTGEYPNWVKYSAAYDAAELAYNNNCAAYESHAQEYAPLTGEYNASLDPWASELETWKIDYAEWQSRNGE